MATPLHQHFYPLFILRAVCIQYIICAVTLILYFRQLPYNGFPSIITVYKQWVTTQTALMCRLITVNVHQSGVYNLSNQMQ